MSAKVYCKELIDAEMSKNGYEFLMPIKIYWCNSRGKFYTKYTHIAGLYGKVFGNITIFKFARAIDGADDLPHIGVFDIERIGAREIHIIDDFGGGEYAEVNARNLNDCELSTSGFYFNFPY